MAGVAGPIRNASLIIVRYRQNEVVKVSNACTLSFDLLINWSYRISGLHCQLLP
jgi:hypothetical protein